MQGIRLGAAPLRGLQASSKHRVRGSNSCSHGGIVCGGNEDYLSDTSDELDHIEHRCPHHRTSNRMRTNDVYSLIIHFLAEHQLKLFLIFQVLKLQFEADQDTVLEEVVISNRAGVRSLFPVPHSRAPLCNTGKFATHDRSVNTHSLSGRST